MNGAIDPKGLYTDAIMDNTLLLSRVLLHMGTFILNCNESNYVCQNYSNTLSL